LAGDVDDRRRDLRIFGNRQPHERHRAQDDDDDRDDAGEDRSVDEEVRNPHRLAYFFAAAPAAAFLSSCCFCCSFAFSSCVFGATFAPGRARINPLTMTRSSAARPSLTMRMLLSMTGPSVTNFWVATLSLLTTRTYLRTCSVPIAASGTSSAS